MPGSVPLGPMPLNPDEMGHSFLERPTEETIRIDSWAVGSHCKLLLLPLVEEIALVQPATARK